MDEMLFAWMKTLKVVVQVVKGLYFHELFNMLCVNSTSYRHTQFRYRID